ncbi:MAG: PspC domain-containing protein [Candidatus Limnocylindrales bacterium]
MNPRRLYRSADDRIFAGVAGGVAAYFDVDPVIVRIIWFLSVPFSGTLTFWAYVVMILVVPLEPSEWPQQSPWAPGGAPLGYGAGYTPTTPGTGPATAPDAPGAPVDAGAAPGAVPTGTQAFGPGTTAPGSTGAPAAGGWWGSDWRSQRRAERWQRRAERHAYRNEHGGPGLVFGLLLILVGGLLVLQQAVPSFNVNLTWPIVIIGLGAILIASSLRFGGRD